ncbi:MAG: ATP-binding protein [Peptostreptococcaceae bacterium]|nr:ATP-binding protein [Peptostreptococcaceae bacterium]
MLIQFSVENYLSFKGKTILSLVPSQDKENTGNTAIDGKYSCLKSVAVYGANASGKSNLIRAFFTAIMAIRTSNGLQVDSKIPGIIPFKFDKSTQNEPTKFEFIFTSKGIKYVYGFSATQSVIVDEYLYCYLTSKPTTIFERSNTNTYKFPTTNRKELNELSKRNTANKLFLSTATTWNYEKTKEAFVWFSNSINTFTGYSGLENIAFDKYENDKDGNLKKFTNNLLKASDINISNFTFESELMTKENVKITTEHNITDKDGNVINYDLALQEESLGTQNLFNLSPFLKNAFENGESIIIDEIDTTLHPLLVRYIIDLFHDKEINKNNAQLIFTTHDINLLTLELFRRDQIYFTEKNNKTGESDLYSLDEFPVRKTENIRNGYMQGRYGSIPFISGGFDLWD